MTETVGYKFNVGDIVQHLKTSGRYEILATPKDVRIESTNQPAYLYRDVEGGYIWVRTRTVMEDGRFSLFYRPAQKEEDETLSSSK